MFLLPYMEQQPLYNAINFNFMWGPNKIGNWNASVVGQQNSTVRVTVINALLCPSDPSPAIDTDQRRRDRQQPGGRDVLRRQPRRQLPGVQPRRRQVVTFCASQGYNCRGAQLGDPTSHDHPPVPGRPGSGIFWRECSGVPLAADHRRHLATPSWPASRS